MDTVVHCANGTKDTGVERRLATAMNDVTCPHLVYVSIVGVDRVPLAYYRTKLAAERSFEDSGVPLTILRATQFHDLIRVLLAIAARSPLMPIPSLPFQPIDIGEVATRLAGLAAAEPAGRVTDMGGPQILPMHDFAHTYLQLTGRRRAMLPITLAGKTFRAYRDGGHLTPEHAAGKVTFEEYLRHLRNPRTTSYRDA